MRNNGPVTQRDIPMRDGEMIVSSTDDKGRILSANDYFFEIANFTRDEIIGQPHNVIRHPDMPPEAFEDMWRDLKSGKPWSGYVKNRTKNGDHYWVYANAMPVVESGRITGYISIRNKPNAEAVKAVEPIYQEFLAGKAGSRVIKHGQIVDMGWRSKVSRWFERLGSKILCVAIGLCSIVALVGAVGMYVSQKESEGLRSVYEDRLVPSARLAEMSQRMYDNIVKLGFSHGGSAEQIAKIEAAMTENSAEITRLLTEYQNKKLAAEEKEMVEHYIGARAKFVEQVIKPGRELAHDNRMEELRALISEKITLFDDVAATNDKLLKYQITKAEEEFAASKVTKEIGMYTSIGVIIAGIIIAMLTSRYLSRVLLGKLDYLNSRLNSISGGNLTTEINVSNDELANIMTSVKALQAKLGYAELEKKQAEVDKKLGMHKLADDFEKGLQGIISSVAAAATELYQTAESLNETASQAGRESTQVAQASQQTAGTVQSVAAAAEEMVAAIKEINSQIGRSTEAVREAVERVDSANQQSQALASATNSINSMAEQIEGIAGQINLLALNATIESARAGEAGKGFAVVASEVKALAGQTGKTTEEIRSQISGIQDVSKEVMNALTAIQAAVSKVQEFSGAISAAVEEQGAVNQEVAKNIVVASTGVEQINKSIGSVSQSVQTTSSATQEVLGASKMLSQQAEKLSLEVQTFLQTVRAA